MAVPVLEKEVAEYVKQWNSHLIRKNKQCQTPSGIPDEIYSMPEVYGNAFHIAL